MNIDTKDIIDSIQQKNDIFYTVLLLRLYDEYQNVYSDEFDDLEEISLIKINNAYNKILKKFNNIKLKKYDYFGNHKVLSSVETQINMLSNYISNFDVNNMMKIKSVIDLITNLECLLKLSITFPQNIKNCILSQMNNDELNNKEIKRRLNR